MLLALLVCVLALVRASNSANILYVNPSPSYSHQIAFNHLLKELSLRGHRVTSITMFPMNDPTLTNLTEINVFHCFTEFSKDFNLKSVIHGNDKWDTYRFIWNISLSMSKAVLSDTNIQDLITKKTKFDVVLVKLFYPSYLAFGKIYNCPTILLSSYYLEDYYHYAMGNPVNPISHPNMMLPFKKTENFKERIMSVIFTIYRWYTIMYTVLPRHQELINNQLNMSVSIHDLISEIDLTLYCVHPVLQEIRSIGPNTIPIGYKRPPQASSSLKEDLKTFMDKAKDGFVYFSLGSNVNSKDLDKDLFRTIMEALGEIPLKIVYKYEGDDVKYKPDNVHFIKWAPQSDILRHRNIKLFITQGGFQSMEEAIYSSVPMLVMPFFVDQYHNAKLIEKRGIGKMVNPVSLTKEQFVETINELLNNLSYKENVARLAELALDVPMTGLEQAIWWIEYVIRNKGAKHFKNPAVDTTTLPVSSFGHYRSCHNCFLIVCIVLYLLTKKLLRIIYPIKIKSKKD